MKNYGAVYVFDQDLRFLLAEGSAVNLIGYDRKELEGRTIYDLDEQTCHVLEPIYKKVLRDNILQIETEYGDKVFFSKYFPLLNKKGKVELGIVVTHDVTEQKKTERVLREKERQYRELVENANSAIIRWKTDGTITFFNEYAQTFFGYLPDEILGKKVNILVPEKDSSGALLTKLVQDIVSFEWNIQKNEVRRFTSTEPALSSTGDDKFDTFEDILEIVHPDDRKLFKTNIQAAINRKDGKYESEFRFVRPNRVVARGFAANFGGCKVPVAGLP